LRNQSVSEGKRDIFIAGGTGYMGRQLIPRLLERGHRVTALVRAGSEGKLAPGCISVIGDALDKETFAEKIAPADTFVQLVGGVPSQPGKSGSVSQH
jgi:nucleoside-diphosphate-sugar epimerase